MRLGRLWSGVKVLQNKAREKYSHDIFDFEERRKSRFYTLWIDHEVLRIYWHNFAKIAPDVYRSNHPTRARFEKYAAMGIKTVLNLRGATRHSHYKFEAETCEALGLELVDIPLSARSAPPKMRLLEVVDVVSTIQKPFLMHCKSGADRTGLVAAIYLMSVEGQSVYEAKKQLSLSFLHLRFTKTGILDYIIFSYRKRLEKGYIEFREWVETEYDNAEITAGFLKTNLRERLAM
jgi:protein tyrosine/serine phosphatase